MRHMNNISELVKYAFVTLLGTLCLAGCGPVSYTHLFPQVPTTDATECSIG